MENKSEYNKEFFFKLGFYIMTLISVGLFIAWVSTSQSRDNQLHWRREYVYTKAYLIISMTQTDLALKAFKDDRMVYYDIYCNNQALFKVNLARKAYEH